MQHIINRRAVLRAAATLPLMLGLARTAGAATLPLVTVTKDPSCGCCGDWVQHLRAEGFPVRVIESADVDSLKQRLGVPPDLASCHTAEVGGYVVEGHVPAPAIRRMLAQRPDATGLAVPGMPAGSPGMDYPGVAPEPYDVILFAPSRRATFARFNGKHEV
ncbi:DUF411 domain-containing protein [Paracoccus luteus]|uniref:DUF411 domain-containing protein n=1 Tax=Paracoccus luteus TaxID=2508543 RepID=UPI00106F7472|nr:DUF411 domain-containing protein [Paracoccus luteus]